MSLLGIHMTHLENVLVETGDVRVLVCSHLW